MTTRAAFTADEWHTLSVLDRDVGLMIMNATSGGVLRESRALQGAIDAAAQLFPDDELIAAITVRAPVDREGQEKQSTSAPGDTPLNSGAHTLQRIGKAVALLEQKATAQEAENFKRYLYHVAEQVARAHKEGGFLGFGGEQISPMEQFELDELRKALGLAVDSGEQSS